MNVKNTKIPQPRFRVDYSALLNLQTYGSDNLYPQHLRAITSASGTAELCLGRYQKFIEGNGFQNEALSQAEMNSDHETADDILRKVSADVARYGGLAIHVNYNIDGQVTELHHIPFEHCRLEATDDRDMVGRIIVCDDWGGYKRNKALYKFAEEDVERIHVFNPRADVVRAQIEEAGSIAAYKGQILWLSMGGYNVYPTPIYDAAVTEISTDEGLGNVKYRNVRNNFLVSCILVAKKGVPYIDENGVQREQSMIDAEDLRKFQGDENGNKIMLLELENGEDKPEIMEFPTKNFDKDFEATETSVVERIYAQFHQELFYAIRIGKLGFSGSVMRDAYEYYAGEVTTEQRFIERAFARILAEHENEIFHNADTQIQPLRYITLNEG